MEGKPIQSKKNPDEKNPKKIQKNENVKKVSVANNLTPQYSYEGAVWYAREIEIPKSFENKICLLTLGRTKASTVFLDGVKIGDENKCLSGKHVHNLGKIKSGKRYLAIRIDNSKKIWRLKNHLLDYPSPNWNGIIGEINLQARDTTYINRIQIRPDTKNKRFNLRLFISNESGAKIKNAKISLLASPLKNNNADKCNTTMQVDLNTGENEISAILPLGENAKLWSQHNPNLYAISAKLECENFADEIISECGLRNLFANAKQLTLNDTPIFLRGKHDALVFPKTGHPPMSLQEWLDYFKICADYGINHVRYHSCCPPENAFRAADRLGILISVDSPYWGKYDEQIGDREKLLQSENIEILNQYSNYPSFAMFSLGNETTGSRKTRIQMRRQLKEIAPHILYSIGINYDLFDQKYCDGDDYWVCFRTKSSPQKNNGEDNVRASFAHCDAPLGAVQLSSRADGDFSKTLKNSPVPVIGHETGQYLSYPNFDEAAKYDGAMKGYVFEHFARSLKRANLFQDWREFHKASAMCAQICYKREIEMALATPEFGGFQLLDLQDFLLKAGLL